MISRMISRLEENILCLLLVCMTLLVFVEVVLRFGFNTGLHWSQELTLTLSGWFVLFGASYGVKVGAHIGVDVFVKLLPHPVHRAITIFAVLLCLAYCVMFLYGSWIYLDKMRMIGIEMDDIPIPKWTAMSILVIGFVLLIIRFLQLLWKVIKGEVEGFHLADEAKESMEIAKELEKNLDRDQSKHPQSAAEVK